MARGRRNLIGSILQKAGRMLQGGRRTRSRRTRRRPRGGRGLLRRLLG